MYAGQMRTRLLWQAKIQGQDAAGQPSTTWVDVVTVWASVRHVSGLKGLETVLAGQESPLLPASIRIRYRPGVTPAQRVRLDDTVYDIRAVLPDPSGRVYLDLVCEARHA